MRYPYIADKLDEAAQVLSGEGRLYDRLYAAHLKLHTVLPEDFSAGDLRQAYDSIHERFTRRRPDDRLEASVISVLNGMKEVNCVELASDIRGLSRAVHEYAKGQGAADEPPRPGSGS